MAARPENGSCIIGQIWDAIDSDTIGSLPPSSDVARVTARPAQFCCKESDCVIGGLDVLKYATGTQDVPPRQLVQKAAASCVIQQFVTD